ncbi:MAG: nucleoside hydrolase [Holdemanella sp.]|nr:nucleoside hydrolase [Holdemanella sp.]
MERRKVIIDCDPGIDDSLAIMLALASREIEVIGITIVCGNCPVDMGFENAKKVLNHLNRLDVPVYKGMEKPLIKEFVNALDTHGQDGLGESFLENVEGYEQDIDAITFLSNTLRKEKVSIIAIGPLTNIATLIHTDLEAFLNVEEFISMGGACHVPGNCSPVAEYNYWCDPDAAKLVFRTMKEHHRKVLMVPLNVTRQIVLTPELLEYMKQVNKVQGDFVEKITKFYFYFHLTWENLIGCVINDPLAVAYFINRNLCAGIDAYVDIETQGISIGQSVVDTLDFYKNEKNAHVLTSVDEHAFFEMFFSKVLDIPEEQLKFEV